MSPTRPCREMQSLPCRLPITHRDPELVKTSNHAFTAPFWPESTSHNASGAIISSAVGVKVLPPTLADHGLTNPQTLNPREQTMTMRPP
jgi:hypothetical protein